MRIKQPRGPLLRDEAAAMRFSVFVRGPIATVKVRAQTDTAYYELPCETLFPALEELLRNDDHRPHGTL